MRGLQLILLTLLFALAPTGGVLAEGGEGLYEAEMVVATQSAEERESALRTGLKRVITRVTGHKHLVHPELSDALASAERYVQQFRYSVRDGDRPGSLLWARYDATAINTLLEEAGLPVWGRVRPTTLAWIVVDDGGERLLLDSRTDHRVRGMIEQQTRQLGMPLRWPMMDLTDASTIRPSDVRGGYLPAIREASGRYTPEAILVGRLQWQDWGGWSGRWHLMGIGQTQVWQTYGVVLSEVVDEGIERAFLDLAAAYAGGDDPLGEGGTVVMDIYGITGLRDYVRVRDYLGGLTEVREVALARVETNRVALRLSLRGSSRDLARIVALGGTLLPAGDGPSEVGRVNLEKGLPRLEYRYLP